NAPVMAPFANLPPPAMDARPPSTLFAARLATLKLRPLMNGPAAEVTPAERAPDWHVEPEATAEAQPTRAWPAMLARCASENGTNEPCEPSNPGMAPPSLLVKSPTALNASAVAPAMTPALSAAPKFPLVTPATNAAAPAATSGTKGVHAPSVAATQIALAAIWMMLPMIGTERSRCCSPCNAWLKK